MDPITGLGILLVGMIFGGAVGWLVRNGRDASAIATAVANGQTPLLLELGQLRERGRLTDKQLEDAATEYSRLNDQAVAWREALDRSSNEHARLEERSSRVPIVESECMALRSNLAALSDEVRGLAASKAVLEEQVARLSTVEQELQASREGTRKATEELATLRSRAESDAKHFDERLQLLLAAKEELSNQFKTLASEILEENGKRFKAESNESLNQILDPLKSKITEFKTKVEEVYIQEGKDRSALAGQVQKLVELNQALSQDAKNLTVALKGSARAQGSWGELILERVLEASGLRKGSEYIVQASETREDGTRAQPDVVIKLPEERNLIVDAKVSLVAYDRYIAADSDADRASHLRQHLESVRTHIRGLSEKRYEALYGIKSLDFVIAFIPIEPAFMMAITSDEGLFMDAWRLNVLLVSPSTLLFVVRTVAHLWRQEAQKTNAQDIAKRGGELYDKLAGFVEELQAVGSRLTQAQKAYDNAYSKLAIGRGNVLRQAEMLREMGVKPSKTLPAPTLEAAHSLEDAVVIPASPRLPFPDPEMGESPPIGADPAATGAIAQDAEII